MGGLWGLASRAVRRLGRFAAGTVGGLGSFTHARVEVAQGSRAEAEARIRHSFPDRSLDVANQVLHIRKQVDNLRHDFRRRNRDERHAAIDSSSRSHQQRPSSRQREHLQYSARLGLAIERRLFADSVNQASRTEGQSASGPSTSRWRPVLIFRDRRGAIPSRSPKLDPAC